MRESESANNDPGLDAVKLYDPERTLVWLGHTGRYRFRCLIDDGARIGLAKLSKDGKRTYDYFDLPADKFEREFDVACDPVQRARIRTRVLKSVYKGEPQPAELKNTKPRHVKAALKFLRSNHVITTDDFVNYKVTERGIEALKELGVYDQLQSKESADAQPTEASATAEQA